MLLGEWQEAGGKLLSALCPSACRVRFSTFLGSEAAPEAASTVPWTLALVPAKHVVSTVDWESPKVSSLEFRAPLPWVDALQVFRSGALCCHEVWRLWRGCSSLWNSRSCLPLSRWHNSKRQFGKQWTFRGSFDVGKLFFCTVYWDQREAQVNNCFGSCGCCAPRAFWWGHSAVSLVAVDVHRFVSSVTVGFCSCALVVKA